MLILINVDNINSRDVPYVIESVLDRGGNNIHFIPAITKKGRNEYLLLVDVDDEHFNEVVRFLAVELGTLGFRTFEPKHVKFNYEIEEKNVNVVNEKIHLNEKVRIKVLKGENGNILTASPEYEDLRKLAKKLLDLGVHIPLTKLRGTIESQFMKNKTTIKISINERKEKQTT